jgi:hypothetical protein
MSAAARVVGHAAKRAASTTATKRGGEQGEKFLKQGARRDPELYVRPYQPIERQSRLGA